METDQSEIFGKSLNSSIKALKNRGVGSVQRMATRSGDMDFLDKAEREYIELNLDRMRLETETKKAELKALESAEIRSTQCDRIREARENLKSLIVVHQSGHSTFVQDDILKCLDILREVSNIGGNEIVVQNREVDIEQFFHLSEENLNKSLMSTNVMDFIRGASKHGWNMTIDNNEIRLLKDGKSVAEIGMDFIDHCDAHRNPPVKINEPGKSKKKKVNTKEK